LLEFACSVHLIYREEEAFLFYDSVRLLLLPFEVERFLTSMLSFPQFLFFVVRSYSSN